ncbi:MAG: type II secretion system F family protein [Planctomycetota bacterium]
MSKREITLQQQISVCKLIAKLVRAQLPISGQLAKAMGAAPSSTKELATQVDEDVQAGKVWSDALLADERPETQVLAACIEAGEASQRLDDSLQSWTGMHIANTKARRSFLSALVYPLLLILITIVALTCLSYSLIPQYRQTYLLFDQDLPLWLEWIVSIRENAWAMVLFIVAGTVGPLLVFAFLKARSRSGNRDKQARSLRLQALSADMAAFMTSASVALQRVTEVAARAAGATQKEAAEAWELIQAKKTVPVLPRESSMLLGSAHAGILNAEETSQHLEEVALNLRRSAEMLESAHARWAPMLVALSVGAVTILSYVFLIFLPWIWLMQKIADPVLL